MKGRLMTIQKGDKIALKHGHCASGRTSSTYLTWASMVKRCRNPKAKDYHYYGGRGINVCNRWLKFENFLEDMGEKPQGRTLDRINNEQGYNKRNCRWITHKENCNNRRNSDHITHNGETRSLSQWAEKVGISQPTLWRRIYQRGWSVANALTTPVRKMKNAKRMGKRTRRQA
jgi:hypothetical protein